MPGKPRKPGGATPRDQRLSLIQQAEEHHRRYLQLQEERQTLYPIIEAAVAEIEQDDSVDESSEINDDLPMLKHELEDLEAEAPITELEPKQIRDLLPDSAEPTGSNSLLRRLATAERRAGDAERVRQEMLTELADAREREYGLQMRQAALVQLLNQDTDRRMRETAQRRTKKRYVLAGLTDGVLPLALATSGTLTPRTREASRHFFNSKMVQVFSEPDDTGSSSGNVSPCHSNRSEPLARTQSCPAVDVMPGTYSDGGHDEVLAGPRSPGWPTDVSVELEELKRDVSPQPASAFAPDNVRLQIDKEVGIWRTTSKESAPRTPQSAAEKSTQRSSTEPVPSATYIRMLMVSTMFFLLGFVPLVSTQHHAQHLLLSASAQRPALVRMSYYSQYTVDVVAEIEGRPWSGIAETSADSRRSQPLAGASDYSAEVVLEAYLIECEPAVAARIDNGTSPLSQALRIGTPDMGFQMKQGHETQHLHFTLDADTAVHHEEHMYLAVECNSTQAVSMVLKVHDLGFTGPFQEILALGILLVVLILMVFELVHHTLAALFGSYAVLCVLAVQHRMPSITEAVMWMDHGTLALLWGMMVIVGVTAKTGVFEYVAVRLYKQSEGNPFKLLVLICCLDIVLSAFLDNVTTMLLLGPVCVQLCVAVHRDPRPFLVCLALFGNIGGTATMIGDPPNIIIGNMLSEYVSFNDFIIYLAPGVAVCVPLAFVAVKWFFHAELQEKMLVDAGQLIRDNPIRDSHLLAKAGIMLSCVIIGFFLHPISHIDPVFVAVPGAILVFALDNHRDVEDALHGVEWDTLLFFGALFVMVEGLAEMGLIRVIARSLSDTIVSVDVASRQPVAIVVIMYVSAVTSAFVDNIPYTTTMVPVIRQIALEVSGVSIQPLIWSLSFGACLGGMGTLIGASDNMVAAGIGEKAGYHISFVDFMKIGFPMMLLCVTVATGWLLLLHYAGVWPV